MAFEKFSVADLRDILVTAGLTEDEAHSIKGKSELVYKIKLLQGENKVPEHIELTYHTPTPIVPEEQIEMPNEEKVLDKLMDNIEQIAEDNTKQLTPQLMDNFGSPEVHIADINKNALPVEIVPNINSPEWQDFIMSKFLPEEMDNGNPKVAGLRRLAQSYLGEIVFSAPVQVFPSTTIDGCGRATVIYQVKILWKLGIPEYFSANNCDLVEKVFGGVGEGWEGNIKGEIFQRHPVTIAETRAEGRALRKALNLRNVLAAEELGSSELSPEAEIKVVTEYNEQDLASSAQQSFIKTMCNRLKVDVDKVCPNLSKITKQDALALNKKLTEYQQNVDLIPKDLLIKE